MTDEEQKKQIFTSYTDSESGEQHTAEVLSKKEYEKQMASKSPAELPIDGENLNPPKPSSN